MWQTLRKQLQTLSDVSGEVLQRFGDKTTDQVSRCFGAPVFGATALLSTYIILGNSFKKLKGLLKTILIRLGIYESKQGWSVPPMRLLSKTYRTEAFGNTSLQVTRQTSPNEIVRRTFRELDHLHRLLAKLQIQIHGRRSK